MERQRFQPSEEALDSHRILQAWHHLCISALQVKFYSTSSNTMDPEKKLRGREEDQPGVMFLKKVFQHQAYQGRGYGFEQPWGSTMPTESALRPEQIPGCRKKRRCDQCMLGPHLQTFLNQSDNLRLTDVAEDALFDVMKFAEVVPPFVKRFLGYMPEHKIDGIQWRSVPSKENFDEKMFNKIQEVAASLTMRKLSGMIWQSSQVHQASKEHHWTPHHMELGKHEIRHSRTLV